MYDSFTDILTVKETQALLKVSKKTIYRLIASGDIKARKVGRNYRISKRSIMGFMGEWE